MTKRLRAPKAKVGELKAQWGKVEGQTDVCYAWGDGVSKCDAHLLGSVLASKRCRSAFPGDKEWGQSFSIVYDPSFLDELEDRGYDITTLKFSIQKKKVV